MRIKPFSVAFILIALTCLASLAIAQGERGTITGVITDPTAAVIPNVEVTAVQIETNVIFKAVSTDTGVYRIPYLPPGNYRVSAGGPGFKTAIVSPVVVT